MNRRKFRIKPDKFAGTVAFSKEDATETCNGSQAMQNELQVEASVAKTQSTTDIPTGYKVERPPDNMKPKFDRRVDFSGTPSLASTRPTRNVRSPKRFSPSYIPKDRVFFPRKTLLPTPSFQDQPKNNNRATCRVIKGSEKKSPTVRKPSVELKEPPKKEVRESQRNSPAERKPKKRRSKPKIVDLDDSFAEPGMKIVERLISKKVNSPPQPRHLPEIISADESSLPKSTESTSIAENVEQVATDAPFLCPVKESESFSIFQGMMEGMQHPSFSQTDVPEEGEIVEKPAEESDQKQKLRLSARFDPVADVNEEEEARKMEMITGHSCKTPEKEMQNGSSLAEYLLSPSPPMPELEMEAKVEEQPESEKTPSKKSPDQWASPPPSPPPMPEFGANSEVVQTPTKKSPKQWNSPPPPPPPMPEFEAKLEVVQKPELLQTPSKKSANEVTITIITPSKKTDTTPKPSPQVASEEVQNETKKEEERRYTVYLPTAFENCMIDESVIPRLYGKFRVSDIQMFHTQDGLSIGNGSMKVLASDESDVIEWAEKMGWKAQRLGKVRKRPNVNWEQIIKMFVMGLPKWESPEKIENHFKSKFHARNVQVFFNGRKQPWGSALIEISIGNAYSLFKNYKYVAKTDSRFGTKETIFNLSFYEVYD